MKKTILSILTLFITITTFAQTPELINYQAIIRNADGSAVSETSVGMQISILQTSATGTAVYTETHTVMTNTNGLITILIGGGTSSGDFSTIDWSNGPYFIKTETDVQGGNNYTLVGTSQLLSVPYALYAKNGSKFTETANGLEYNGGNITLTQPGATIQLTSPDGTVYDVGVNDNGQLSVPTSNAPSTTPTQLYLYGSFNNWDASTALQFANNLPQYGNIFSGIKYFDAGTELKFLAAQNESIVYGGNSPFSGDLVVNGNAIVLPNSGLYVIRLYQNSNGLSYQIQSVNATFNGETLTYGTDGSGEFFFFTFLPTFEIQGFFSVDNLQYGDNLGDFSIEHQGAPISTNGFDNFIALSINFNFAFTYQFL